MSNSRYIVHSLKAGRDFYSFRLKSATYCSVVVTFFIMTVLFSCKKVEYVSIGKINGPAEVCYASLSEIYFIDSVPDAKIIWTVPEDAEIISGQTTSKIKVKFGRKEGKILANYYRKGEVISDSAAFLNITFGVPGKWCQIPDFGGGDRYGSVAFSIGDKAYVGTGLKGNAKQNDFWEYNPDGGVWIQRSDFPGLKRMNAVGFSIGGKGYIGTGNADQIGRLSDFWEYDPASNSWLQKADCGTVSREYAFGFSIGNRGYIGGGSTDNPYPSKDLYEYNPDANEWIKKADVAVERIGAVAFSIETLGYIVTGNSGVSDVSDFWEFDPFDSTNGFDVNNNPIGKWTQKQALPAAGRRFAVGFSIGNNLYVGTGVDSDSAFNDFWQYNSIVDTGWVRKENFPNRRAYAVAFSVNNKGYIGTGNDNNVQSKDFYVFTD